MRCSILLFVLGLAACTKHGPATPSDSPDLSDSSPITVDMATPIDLAKPLDFTTPPDLTSGPDMAEAPDEAILTWTPPTMNTDGSPITNLGGYFVYHGTVDPITVANANKIDVGNVTTYTFLHLAPGTHYFAVSTYNTDGVESDFSMTASKVIP
jgi:hypothetical protein